jgi:hypothetical protein
VTRDLLPALDRQDWVDGLRRKWGLVTCEGLPPTGDQSFADALVRACQHVVGGIEEARAAGMMPLRPLA